MNQRVVVFRICAGLLGLIAVAGPVVKNVSAAEPPKFGVDGVHSSVVFRIKHMEIAYFYGCFNEVGGSVAFDAANLDESSLEVSVKVESIDTRDEKRDAHVLGPDFFDAKKYPEITFKGSGFKLVGDDTYEVAGELTMHGQTKPLTVKLTKTGEASDPWGGYRVGFESTFTVDRTKFGIEKMRPALGDDVQLTVSLECVRKKDAE